MFDRFNAFSVYEEDHRTFGMPDRQFSPTLRIKALAAAILLGLLFWGGLFYLIFG